MMHYIKDLCERHPSFLSPSAAFAEAGRYDVVEYKLKH